MAEFLELIETLDAEAASIEHLFGGEGARMRLRNDKAHLDKVNRLAEVIIAAQRGSARAEYVLKETMTTSDFSNLFGDIIQRQLLGQYREAPATYRNYARISTDIPDFRTVKRLAVDGAQGVLGSVPELTEYPESHLTDAAYTYAVQKFGRRLSFSLEAIINDDLGGLGNIGERFARAARRSEEKFATQLFVDANGPHASFYTSGNKNIVNTANGASSNNPALSIQALQDAFIVLSKMVDADGEPIFVDVVDLVVPPALETVAQNILHATELLVGGFGQTGGGGVAAQQLQVANWMKNRTRLNVNYYVPNVASSTNGNSSWFLFASSDSGRPAIEVGFLRGYGEPQMFRRIADQVPIAGGAAGLESFDTDTIDYKIRHIFGGVRLDPRASVASNGSGS